MAYHNNPFSESDDEIIRHGYDRCETLPQIGAKLKRSLHSVAARARLLGIRHPNGTRNGKARQGHFYMGDARPLDLPTLAHVPGISVTGRYAMRTR